MTTNQLDQIEARQIRMENDIKALIDQVGILITRGAEQAEARFPGSQPALGKLAAGLIASSARA